MNLDIITKRKIPPAPWSEGDNIPWNDPDFSRRMLAEHLSQDHDMASRRTIKIEGQTGWINDVLLKKQPSRILDLACGPGLYSNKLAQLGHTCFGIDFSPASIEYAQKNAQDNNLDCKYLQRDIRTAEYGRDYDLALFIYGEFNVFKAEDIAIILNKIKSALKPGGILLIEPHRYEAIRRLSETNPSWQTAESGLFADNPHIWMSEAFWNEDIRAGTLRYFVIESGSEKITAFSASYQAYTDEQYREVLNRHGFSSIEFYPYLPGYDKEPSEDFIAVTCRK